MTDAILLLALSSCLPGTHRSRAPRIESGGQSPGLSMNLEIDPQDFHRTGFDGHHIMRSPAHLTDWQKRDWWHGHRDRESESVTYVGRPDNGTLMFRPATSKVTAEELNSALRLAKTWVAEGKIKVRGVPHYSLIQFDDIADTFAVGVEDWIPSKFGEIPS